MLRLSGTVTFTWSNGEQVVQVTSLQGNGDVATTNTYSPGFILLRCFVCDSIIDL